MFSNKRRVAKWNGPYIRRCVASLSFTALCMCILYTSNSDDSDQIRMHNKVLIKVPILISKKYIIFLTIPTLFKNYRASFNAVWIKGNLILELYLGFTFLFTSLYSSGYIQTNFRWLKNRFNNIGLRIVPTCYIIP